MSVMQGRLVLITGGNTGVGMATARALAAMGARVLITSRDEERGRAAIEALAGAGPLPVELLRLDLASFASIRGCAAAFGARHEALDVLINNAGVILGRRQVTEDGFEATFGINHVGHFLLTDLLRPSLARAAAARIVVVSSRAHRRVRGMSFDDLQRVRAYRSVRVYGESKLANLLFTRALARRLEGTGMTANAVHPGLVGSQFALDGDASPWVRAFFRLGRPFMRTPERGARASVRVASEPSLDGVSGRFFDEDGETTPRPWALDDEAAERLWAATEEMVTRGGPIT